MYNLQCTMSTNSKKVFCLMKNNIIADKSKFFAIRIIRLYKYLQSEKQEYYLSKQIVRSGTSIGANIREAIISFSNADFVYKMNTALKESFETEYWLELLHETDYISDTEFNSIYKDCNELAKLLTAIVKTSKTKK